MNTGIWTVVIRCPNGHNWIRLDTQLNVDGHAIVPLLPTCAACKPPSARHWGRFKVWREVRRFRRQLG